jgi:hypothetical protein
MAVVGILVKINGNGAKDIQYLGHGYASSVELM